MLTYLIEDFDKYMEKLDNVQSQIEIEIEIEQLHKGNESAGNFRDKMIMSNKKARKCQ